MSSAISASGISGVLIIDKPRGPTSHTVVAMVRKALRSRHVGHAGTLDPMATGVLVVAVGEATKLVPWLTASAKEYVTTIRLGIETDTLDAEGKEVARAPITDAELRANVSKAIASERARTMQSPPAYSAIKIDGERAHALARAGRLAADAELPARPVEVSSLELLAIQPLEEHGVIDLSVSVAVSKGYFVRSLARDLARRLHTVGHLTMLQRTRSGAFRLCDAISVDAISPKALLSTTDAATRSLPVTRLNEAGVRAASLGQRVLPQHRVPLGGGPPAEGPPTEGLPAEGPPTEGPSTEGPPTKGLLVEGPSAWIDAATSRLVAIGECDAEGVGRVLRGFPTLP